MEICIKEWPMARNHYGSTEDTEGTDFFLVATLEILEEIFFKNGLWPEINHRNLDGIYTETKSLRKS